MITTESKKRRFNLGWLVVAVLAVVFVGSALAQEEPVADDPLLELPGRIEGTGTYFEVTDSGYLNITFESSEPVHLILESVPEMIVMDIEAAEGATSTQITLTGFPPSTTYYKYEDDYHNGIAFTTDDNGSFTFVQDLSESHLVFIQPNAGTKFIPQDTSIGTWDPVNRIFTLATDVSDTIQIDEGNLTLDGGAHTVTGPGSGYGVYLNGRTGVTIKNLNAQQFTYGISLYYSSNNTLTNNTASSNWSGIYLNNSSGNTLTANTASNGSYGIYLYSSISNTLTGNTTTSNGSDGIFLWFSSGNTLTGNSVSRNGTTGVCLGESSNNALTGNIASNNWNGIYLDYSSGNTLAGNTTASNGSCGILLWDSSVNTLTGNTAASNNRYGILLFSSGNQIYNNNFIDNTTQVRVSGSGNVFNLDKPIGGNYWSDWTSPDNDSDGFVDFPYVFTNGQDNLPWTCQDGWVAAGVTWAGTDVVVQPEDQTTGQTPVTLTFDEVTEVGVTTVTSTTPSEQHGSPQGFRFGTPPVIYEITTTAQFPEDSNVTVCIDYSGISFQGDANNLTLCHFENGEWVDVTVLPVDTVNKIICGQVTYLSAFAIFEPDKLPVSIDIKPGSYPNAINLGSYGLVPVAILSSEQFDATTVDPDTVELTGAGVAVRGKGSKLMAHEEDVNGDGLVDFVVQIQTENLDPDSFQDGYAVLTGETYDGVPIEGADEITIVPPQ